MSYDSALRECRLSNLDQSELKLEDDLGASYYIHTTRRSELTIDSDRDYYQNYSGAYQQHSNNVQSRINRFDNSWSDPNDGVVNDNAAEMLDNVHSDDHEARIQNMPSSK